jgi:TPR repeat protein
VNTLRFLARLIVVVVLAVGGNAAVNQTSAEPTSVEQMPISPEDVRMPAPDKKVTPRFTVKSSIATLEAGCEQGDPLAELILGQFKIYGYRVPRDAEQGLRLLKSSADKGFTAAMVALGALCLNGNGVPKDYTNAVEWFKLAAAKNDSDAERELGVCYQSGLGVDTNFTTAAKWYERAALHTNYVAMKDLGVLYINGTGVPTNMAMAVYWFTQAAKKGENARAMYNLGVLAENGYLGSNSTAIAISWYRQSAGLGDPRARLRLAECYHDGIGVPPDQAKYIYLAAEAAAQGDAEAQCYLGEAYRTGDGVHTNKDVALKWFLSAATNNYPEACFIAARCYLEDKTNQQAQVEANRYMLQAAQAGHREAQIEYALFCAQGTGMPKDWDQSVSWIRKSAESGWPKAEFILAHALITGEPPFSKNEAEGEKWLERAAKQGYLDALDTLAIRLMLGKDGPPNKTEAMKCWRWAAEHGDAKAQNDLGYTLIPADATKTDLAEAYMWLYLAAKAGNPKAKANLANITVRLTHEQIQQAIQRAKDFRPEPMPQFKPVVRHNDPGTPSLDILAGQ